MKIDLLKNDLERCGLSPEIHQLPFSDFKKIQKMPGLYSIWQNDTCIYVGQGGGNNGIKQRFPHHNNKAYGNLFRADGKSNGTQDGVGWKDGRMQDWWEPSVWEIEYFECKNAIHRTYLEGAMMLIFNPFCNDESYIVRAAANKN